MMSCRGKIGRCRETFHSNITVWTGKNLVEAGQAMVDMCKRRTIVSESSSVVRERKGKVLDSCLVAASIDGLEVVSLSDTASSQTTPMRKHWIRRISYVNRVKRRMKDDRLAKISETKQQAGCRKRETPQLRWGDCLKIDLRGRRKVERKGKQRGAMEK